MFFRNLNVFIACLFAGGLTLAAPIGMFVSIALSSFIDSKNMPLLGIGSYLGYLLLAVILANYWRKSGLSPTKRKQGREGRFIFGHLLLGLTNALVIGTLAGPILLAKITNNSNLGMYAWYSLPIFMFGLLAWPVGLLLVWNSRA